MKNLKSLLMLVAILLSVAAMAQDRPQRGGRGQGGRGRATTVQQRAERETSNIHKAVELTDKQIESIFIINYKYAAQDSVRMSEMFAQGGQGQQMNPETMMKQMQERQAAKNAEIKAVLTPEQQKKYDAMLAEQQKQMQQRMQGGFGGPQGGFGGGPQGGFGGGPQGGFGDPQGGFGGPQGGF